MRHRSTAIYPPGNRSATRNTAMESLRSLGREFVLLLGASLDLETDVNELDVNET